MLFKSIILCLLVVSPALGSAIKGHASRAEEPAAPTKGLHREEPTKGGRLLAPIEQHRQLEASKTAPQAKLEIKEEKKEQQQFQQQQEQRLEELQQQQVAEQKLEDLSQQQQQHEPELPLTQQRVEAAEPAAPTKTLRYEAKPQVVAVREEAPAKGQPAPAAKQQPQAVAQKEERYEQVVELQKEQQATKQQEQKQVSFEQEKIEQQQVQRETFSQQVEIKQEQQQQQFQYQQHHQQEQRRLDDSQLQQQQELLAQEEIQQIRQEPIQQAPVKGGPAPLGQAEPYAFEYSVEGSSRRESGDINGHVRGQYTIQGSDGSSRIVDYVADANGFRASVNTNEFGTEARSPAGVELRSSQPEAQDISLRLEGKTRESLQPPQAQQQPLYAVKGAPAPAFVAAAPVPAKPENWQATKSAHREQQQILLPAELPEAPKAAPTKGAPKLEEQKQILAAEPYEAPRATKGAAIKLEEPAAQLIVKAPPAASKGESEPKQQQLEQIELVQATSIDRRPLAEYRASPKSAIIQASGPIRASGFESATAHRQQQPAAAPQPIGHHQRSTYFVQPPQAILHHPQPAPAVPVRQLVAPARSHYRQQPATVRGAHYQAERHYPAAPAAYTRTQSTRPYVGEQQPRALNLDDETLNSNFDRSS